MKLIECTQFDSFAFRDSLNSEGTEFICNFINWLYGIRNWLLKKFHLHLKIKAFFLVIFKKRKSGKKFHFSQKKKKKNLKNIYQLNACPTQITSLLTVSVLFCSWQFVMYALQYYLHSPFMNMRYVHLCDIHLLCLHNFFFLSSESSWKRRLNVENKQWTLYERVSGFFYTIPFKWKSQPS